MTPPVPPGPDPPGPGPEPPEPTTPDYTFKITNAMNQSYYFRVYALNEFGDIEDDPDWYVTSELTQLNSTAELTITSEFYEQHHCTGFWIRYSSGPGSFTADIQWRVNGSAMYTLVPPTDDYTFTGTYAGNNASTIGVWSE